MPSGRHMLSVCPTAFSLSFSSSERILTRLLWIASFALDGSSTCINIWVKCCVNIRQAAATRSMSVA